MNTEDQPISVSKSRQDSWSSKMGIIMAVAGSAIGLGNFLRFPAKAVENGGGAFMIPYFISLLLIGIPLMWIEWTLGRRGGNLGSGTAPGIFQSLSPKNRYLKYLGVLGVLGPLLIFIYYTYIESWTLAYSIFSLFNKIPATSDVNVLKSFLAGFQGVESNQYFNGLGWAYLFFLITFALNIFVIYFGIRRGIERLCKIALPVLFICGIALLIRVMTLGTPNPLQPDWNVSNGFGFLWNPDFSKLLDAKVWLEASGQILFTLSVGIGVILTYSSYLSKKDDVALSGLTSAGTNELAEVILGGSIVIPAAFIFFGGVAMQTIAQSGTFNLGCVTMPAVFNQLPYASIFSFIWFLLLFIAGITSSVSLAQPFVAFLQDEFCISRKKAVGIIAITAFILCHPPIFFLKNGVVDELDFWGGSFFLVVFATIEVILFGWVFGIDKAWKELNVGAAIKIPKIYKYIIKYVTPVYLIVILGTWFVQQWLDVILMKNVSDADKPYIFFTRFGIIILFLVLAYMVKITWRKKALQGE